MMFYRPPAPLFRTKAANGSNDSNSRSPLQVMDLEDGLLRWRGEAAFDALLQSGHQDAVAEPLPTLLGVVDCDDRPPPSPPTTPQPRGRSVPSGGCHCRGAPPRLTPRTVPSSRLESDAQSRTPCRPPLSLSEPPFVN